MTCVKNPASADVNPELQVTMGTADESVAAVPCRRGVAELTPWIGDTPWIAQ